VATYLTVTFFAAAPLVATVAPAHAGSSPAVTCQYTFTSWPGGFTADLAMANSGPTIDGWTTHWTFATPTQATASWSARLAQANPVDIVATPMPWNKVIPTGATVSFGWTGIAAATEVPTDVTVNGKRC
jgi:endoglucanase